MPTIRDGSVNLLGLTNPGVYVDIIPPSPLIAGVPTNVEGLVGVASWGPVGSPIAFSAPGDCAYLFGTPKIRPFDMATHVWAASLVGGQIAFRGVRVTDGTDVAASLALPASAGTATARYTGTLGNSCSLTFQSGTAIGSYSAIVSFPGIAPERFNSITNAVASLTATAGTGYTSVPTLAISAPQGTNGIQATATASLVVVSQTLGAAGSSYAVNDTITLSNGVILTVATVSSGAVATVTRTNAGSIVSGSTPANPVAQVSTSGSGTGATFNLTWGLGAATVVQAGSGYTSATVTVTGGAGSGGSYTAVVSFWAGLANVLNNGSPIRGRSDVIVFTAGSSTSAPALNTPYTLTGGTDGDTGVGTSQMLGTDTVPRKGMYALRNTNCDAFALCDLTDTTSWATQLSFGISETMLPVVVTPQSDTIAGAVATRVSTATDDYGIQILEGDWPTFYDTQNGLARLVSPQAFALGLYGNLSPEQSPINKPLGGVVATQTSQLGRIVSYADQSVAETGGVDFIGRPSPGGNYFSFMTGRNASSNTIARGIEYTRLTYFIARSLNSFAAGSIVGKLQSSRPDDPTRAKAKALLDSFFAGLASPSVGTDGNGMIDQWSVRCDLSNNPANLQALGYLFAYCSVLYLNVVRYFVIKLAGGGNVSVTSQATLPQPSQFS